MLWVYPTSSLLRRLSAIGHSPQQALSTGEVTLIGWGGMRGVLSLAAALALPLALPSGAGFPQRNPILLLTFVVILISILVQGLTLRPLIGWLGIEADDRAEREEQELRLRLTSQTIDYLGSPAAAGQAPPEILARMQHRYSQRLERLHRRTVSPGEALSEVALTRPAAPRAKDQRGNAA